MLIFKIYTWVFKVESPREYPRKFGYCKYIVSSCGDYCKSTFKKFDIHCGYFKGVCGNFEGIFSKLSNAVQCSGTIC